MFYWPIIIFSFYQTNLSQNLLPVSSVHQRCQKKRLLGPKSDFRSAGHLAAVEAAQVVGAVQSEDFLQLDVHQLLRMSLIM
jgi:hypothetical protein